MREEGQVSPDEHLDRIIAKCREMIELGEKRTQGRWIHDTSRGTIGDVTTLDADAIAQAQERIDVARLGGKGAGQIAIRNANAAFIAACAGPAEAAARSTIAAIELIREVANEDGWASVKHYVDIIRAAWPFEIL